MTIKSVSQAAIIVVTLVMNNSEQMPILRRISNALLLMSQTILIFAIVIAMEKVVKTSIRIKRLTLLKKTPSESERHLQASFTNIQKKLSFSSNFVFNHEFLFQLLTSSFSYLLFILQYELDSTSVSQFDLKDVM